ncbi:MAG: cation:proton antiporter [bacterium]|nr:cation:proton antiporter [bacterium]
MANYKSFWMKGILFWLLLTFSTSLFASGAEEGGHGEAGFYTGLLAMVLIMVVAKVGAEAFERVRQPAVLGELIIGMALGALALAGVTFFTEVRDSSALHLVAEIGVILLLFEVGLESHLGELMEVGLSAMIVAVLGVAAPLGLGYFVSAFFLPAEPWYVHLFVGGTLAATSVGITARVLRDLRKVDTKEARIILGAAVVDDVLGLIILAVISGIVTSIDSGNGSGIEAGAVVWIIGKAILFLVGAIFVGRFLHINAVRAGTRFRVPGVPVVIAISFCFTLAALAGKMGLAPIVGAFAAGLVLEPSDYEVYRRRGEQPIEQLVRPLSAIFTPVFFVMMGLRVDLRAFTSSNVLAFAAVITLAAIAGKQICSLGVLEKGVQKLVVGIGMIPRGEVGLIFTGIGARLAVAGRPVLSSDLVSALIVMVIITTLVTPPILKSLLLGKDRRQTLPIGREIRETP